MLRASELRNHRKDCLYRNPVWSENWACLIRRWFSAALRLAIMN